MTDRPPTVNTVAAVQVPDPLPPAITRRRQHVSAVLAQSFAECGEDGRAALAWQWALTGTKPSPVTLSLAPGRPPAREELLAEADAEPEGSTAPPGVPTDYCDQLDEGRRILRWLVGHSDEIPVDCDNRGHFIGARDDYARTDDEIRNLRDTAQRSLEAPDPCGAMDSGDTRNPGQQDTARMNAAWLRGVRDLLEWVLGDRPTAPLSGWTIHRPTAYDLSYEESAADEVIRQGRPGHHPAGQDGLPPQYGEAIQATIRWLRGETTSVSGAPHLGSPRIDTMRGQPSPEPLSG